MLSRVKKSFKDYINFNDFGHTPQARGGRVYEIKIFVPLTQRCYIPKSVETGSALPEKRLKIYIQSLTHDKKDEQKQTATAGAPE